MGPARNLDFGHVLRYMENHGKKFAREGWNGEGMFIALQVPNAHSKMRRPYIFMSPVDGDLVPWVASQSDLLAHDWYEVEELPEGGPDGEETAAEANTNE